MDELRLVRREDQALIVSNESGDEFRLVVDDSVFAELRHLSRRDREASSRVRPREIQALIRSGKTRAAVAAATGLDEADIERYEEPVLAERRYILERAHAVPVRTGQPLEDEDQRFGSVISERLLALDAGSGTWSSWKDDEHGWMIGLDFVSRDVAHHAVWAFEHRKGTLAPVNPDAAGLSKQGEVGDRLIPKLRAVETGDDRFDEEVFDADDAADDAPQESVTPGADAVTRGGGSEAEYERQREIDHRAIKTDDEAPDDLSQTADLLDALRRRRSQREQQPLDHAAQPERSGARDQERPTPVEQPALIDPESVAPERPEPETPPAAPARSIWSAAGVTGGASAGASGASARLADAGSRSADRVSAAQETDAPDPEPRSGRSEERSKRGRASIPSWDDILFGTRSDEDPA